MTPGQGLDEVDVGVDGEAARLLSSAETIPVTSVALGAADEVAPHLRTYRSVGKGGIGQVLLGFDRRIGREVAVKELQPRSLSDDRMRARFIREAQITGRLEHPGIVPVYEMGTRPDGRPYYVMKFVRGKTLSEMLERCGDEDPDKAMANRLRLLSSLIDSCDAVAYAHAKGVIHRDLKPANIIVGSFGETVILDWGLARAEISAEIPTEVVNPGTVPDGIAEGDGAPLTMPGDILGTPAYMAPEQLNPDLGVVDRRSDVFALGCILHQILTGRPPFEGSAESILSQRQSAPPIPSVRHAASRVPAELAAICDTALALEPSARFPDAGAMARELRAFRDGRLVSTYTYSPMDHLRRFVGRHRVALAAAVITLIAVVFGSMLALRYAMLAEEARRDAEVERVRAESALEEVTGGLKAKLEQARLIARQIRAETESLALDQADVLTKLRLVDVADAGAILPLLRQLKSDHVHVDKFVVSKPPGIVTAVFPESLNEQIGADISRNEHMKWTIENRRRNFSRIFTTLEGKQAVALQYPWVEADRLIGVLSAVFDPGELIAAVLPPGSEDVWVMQEDGLILYSSDLRDVGRGLFSDSALAKYPQLRLFGQSVQREADGIGHVEVFDLRNNKVHWIAAWATFTASELAQWKVVVAKPYVKAPTGVSSMLPN